MTPNNLPVSNSGFNMNILSIMVLLTNGPDKIIVKTDLECPFVKDFMPSRESLSFTFDASANTGYDYCIKNFGVDPEVIDVRK